MSNTDQSTPVVSPEQAAQDAALAAVARQEAALAEAANGAAPKEPAVDQPQDLILGKFKDTDALIQAYKELEARNTKQAQAPTETPKIETPNEGDAAKIATDAGLDVNALNEEYRKNFNAETGQGTLSEETFKALEGKGIPRAMVEGYLRGQEAIAVQARGTLESEAGGAEQLNAALSWASKGLDAADVKAFNDAMGSTDLGTQKMAIRALMASFKASGQFKPINPSGDTSGKPSGASLVTAKTLIEAMQDIRYKPGPKQSREYVAEVERLAAEGRLP